MRGGKRMLEFGLYWLAVGMMFIGIYGIYEVITERRSGNVKKNRKS